MFSSNNSRFLQQLLLLGSVLSLASAAPADSTPAVQDSNKDTWLSATAMMSCPSTGGEQNAGEIYLNLPSVPLHWPRNTACTLAMSFPWSTNYCECHIDQELLSNYVYCDASIVNHNAAPGETTEVSMRWWGSYLFSSEHTSMYLQDAEDNYSCQPNCNGVVLKPVE